MAGTKKEAKGKQPESATASGMRAAVKHPPNAAIGEDPRPTPRRERATIVPAFDPEMLAKELEAQTDLRELAAPAHDQTDRPTITPPFDPSNYARVVDDHVESKRDPHDTPRTITAATPALCDRGGGLGDEEVANHTTGSIGRAMYGSYLQSDYPEALVLAERVLEREPEHALARLVADGCRERLEPPVSSDLPRLLPSSVVRLRRPAHEVVGLIGSARGSSDLTSQLVVGHVDGVCDISMLADLAGIPRPEALDRLHALLELGLLEVVNG